MRIITSAIAMSVLAAALGAQSPATKVVITGAASCPACSVLFTPFATLRSMDSATLVSQNWLAASLRGDLYVGGLRGGPFSLLVFDSSGRSAGRSIQIDGRPERIAIDGQDSIWTYSQRRFSVFSPSTLARVRSFDLQVDVGRWTRLPTGNLAASLTYPSTPGYSVVLMSPTGQFLGALGGTDSLNSRELHSIRIMASRRQGHVWVTSGRRYEIEQYDSSGRLVRSIEREVDWFPRVAFGTPTPPHYWPTPVIDMLREDSDGNLWVRSAVPNPEYWRTHTPSAGLFHRPAGQPPDPGPPPFLFRLEVLDVTRNRVLFSGDNNEMFHVLSNDVVAKLRYESDGHSTATFGRLSLVPTAVPRG